MSKSSDEEMDNPSDNLLLSADQALELAGNAHKYQNIVMLVIGIQCFAIGLVFFGTGLFLETPSFECQQSGLTGQLC